MNKTLKTILNCIGIAVFALLILNLILFGIEIVQADISDNWAFRLKHGVFYVDDRPTGLFFGSAKAIMLMTFIFFVALFRNYRKGNLISI